MYIMSHSKTKFLLITIVSIGFVLLPEFFVSLVYASSLPNVSPMSTSTSIYILPDTTNPSVGDIGHIRVYVFYSEWPWSDGYSIKLWFDSSYASISDHYDTPDIYYDAHYTPPRAEITWYFFPDGGVSGTGSETRPYVDLKYIRAGSFTIYAEVYQLHIIFVFGVKFVYTESRASTQITIYV